MKKLLLALLVLSSFSFAQYVDEIVLDKTINTDGIFIESDSTIYSTEAWNGTRINKISPDGTVEVFATGLKGPIDILKGLDGNFYVSEWTGSSVAKVTSAGEVSKFATIKPGPGPMTMDAEGNIYVTHNINNGSGFVSKIDVEGNVSIYASGSPIVNPGGIDIDDDGNLYVANFNDGRIVRVDTAGNKDVMATVPGNGTWKTGHLKYISGFIYISAIEDHRIYRMDLNGNIEVFAGTGEAGRVNGSLTESKFNNPNGLGKFENGSKLYVTSAFGPANYVQRINFPTTSVAENEAANVGFYLNPNYPNPFNPATTISFVLTGISDVNLVVYDSLGRTVAKLIDDVLQAGTHQIEFDASDLSSGTYLYTLRANDYSVSRKMTLLK